MTYGVPDNHHVLKGTPSTAYSAYRSCLTAQRLPVHSDELVGNSDFCQAGDPTRPISKLTRSNSAFSEDALKLCASLFC